MFPFGQYQPSNEHKSAPVNKQKKNVPSQFAIIYLYLRPVHLPASHRPT